MIRLENGVERKKIVYFFYLGMIWVSCEES